MKNFLVFLAALSTYLAMPSCTPPVTPPPNDAAPPPPGPISDAASPPGPASSPCTTACAAAKAVGCPEGQSAYCASTCTLELADPGMPHPNTSCLAAATSQAAVRACGWTCN